MRGAVLVLILGLGLGACGGATSPCEAALQDAASVDAMADSVADLYPAIRACGDVEEWEAAWAVYSDERGFTGSATSVLRNACSDPEVAAEPLCVEVSG